MWISSRLARLLPGLSLWQTSTAYIPVDTDCYSPEPVQFPLIMTHYQFGGPIGAGLIMLGLPFFVWSVEFIATHNDWSVWPLPVPTLADVANTWSWTAWWVVCGWMLWITTLYYVIPGDIKSGVELPNGKRLRYPMNGMCAQGA